MALALVAACGSGASGPTAALEDARARWATSETTCPSYQYEISNGPKNGYGAGVVTTTALTIDHGHVVSRTATTTEYRETLSGPLPPSTSTWTETGSEVGTHDDSSAAPPRTMDELYDVCATAFVEAFPPSSVVVEADAKGVLLRCGHIDEDCLRNCVGCQALDCFGGLEPSQFSCAGTGP